QVIEFNRYSQLADKLTNNLIVPDSGKITYGMQTPDIKRVTGLYYDTDDKGKIRTDKDGKKIEVPFKLDIPLTDQMTQQLVYKEGFRTPNNGSLLLSLLVNT